MMLLVPGTTTLGFGGGALALSEVEAMMVTSKSQHAFRRVASHHRL